MTKVHLPLVEGLGAEQFRPRKRRTRLFWFSVRPLELTNGKRRSSAFNLVQQSRDDQSSTTHSVESVGRNSRRRKRAVKRRRRKEFLLHVGLKDVEGKVATWCNTPATWRGQRKRKKQREEEKSEENVLSYEQNRN
ncbi:hypothetical protein NL676_034837 [Syzygium grande]|nr:hypothetical protein NL676_034837 [Syzygium grande]